MSRPKTAADVIADTSIGKVRAESVAKDALISKLHAEVQRLRAQKAPPKAAKPRKAKAAKHIARVIVPDSHGAHIDPAARDAFLADLAQIQPAEVVMLGDHLDCGGVFSSHSRAYTNELTESYDDDVKATNEFLDAIQAAAPNAQIWYIEGNHEGRVERWCASSFANYRDAKMVLDVLGPEGVLRLKQRGVTYVRRSEFYDGLSIPGTIRRGKCYFTHGISHGRHATATHVDRFGASVWHGHTHRAASVISRTVTSDGHGAWCPGTLAKLQPLYRHTAPSEWSHGYGVMLENASTQRFAAMLVPIVDGESMLLLDAIGGKR